MKQLLTSFIRSWWTSPLPQILPRETDLIKYFDPKVKKIISVIGFRRSGKTFTLLDFAQKKGKENCIYINFEDERLPKKTQTLTALSETITELKGNKPQILLMDEVQEIPNWSLWARRMNETTPHRLILSGSSSALSSSEIPTELRGQTITIKIFPLSFKEFLSFKNIKKPDLLPEALMLNLIREYLNFGGFPEIVQAEEGNKPFILTSYYSSFVKRDLIERYRIRNIEGLKKLLLLLANTRSYTYSKLTNTIKSLGYNIGKATLIRFMEEIESSFFLGSTEVYSPNIKKRAQAAKKAYIVDNYFSTQYSTNFSQNIGYLMEQSVWQELERQKAKNPSVQTYYWKDYQGHEVDFVKVKKTSINELIQVSFVSEKNELDKRETEPLLKASYELNCQKLTLITWDHEEELKMKGFNISCIPLYKWLINN